MNASSSHASEHLCFSFVSPSGWRLQLLSVADLGFWRVGRPVIQWPHLSSLPGWQSLGPAPKLGVST